MTRPTPTVRGAARARWTKKLVHETRGAIKTELDRVQEQGGPRGRLAHALRRIAELQDDVTSFGVLRCYTYACSLLVLQLGHRVLTEAQIAGLAELAEKLLVLQGIAPFGSPLSFLYAEIYSVLAQIRHLEGNAWEAAWSTQMMLHHSRGAKVPAAYYLALGHRSLRLAQADAAATAYAAALAAEGLSDRHAEAATLGRIKALRLTGDLAGARSALAQAEPGRFSAAALTELAWETACVTAQGEGELRALTAFLDGRDEPALVSYRLEGHLWARSSGRKADEDLVLKIPGLKRRHAAEARAHAPFVKACSLVEGFYDLQVPFHRRLLTVARLETVARAQITLDKELLLLTATIRWLRRFASPDLAQPVLHRYAGLSLQLSQGRTRDVLGLVD